MHSLVRHKPLNRRGPKTRQWEAERRRLAAEFLARGVMRCECRYEGCWGEVQGFAHSKKRREMEELDIREVIAACNVCHRKLDEQMSHLEMLEEVRRIIAARE